MCLDKTCFIQGANAPATSLIFFAQHTNTHARAHTHTHTHKHLRDSRNMCTRIYDNCTQTLHQNEKHFFFIIKTLVLLSVTIFALVCFHEMIVVFSQPFSTTPVFLALRSPLHRLRVNSAQISLKVSILRHCDIYQSG